MAYHVHPLEDGDTDVIFTSGRLSGHSFPPRTQRNFLADSISIRTMHLLNECSVCHEYTKHVDSTLSTDPQARHAYKGRDLYLEGIGAGRHLQLEEDSMAFSRYRGRLQASIMREQQLLAANDRYRRRIESLEKEVMALGDRLMAVQMAYEDISGSPPNSSEYDIGTEGNYSYDSASDFTSEDSHVNAQLHQVDERSRPSNSQFWQNEGIEKSDSESDKYDTSSTESSISFNPDSDTPPSDESGLEEIHNPSLAPLLDSELTIDELTALIEASQEPGNTDALDQVRLLVQDAQRTPKRIRTAAQTFLLLTWRIPTWVLNLRITTATQPAMRPRSSSAPAPSTVTAPPEVFVDASGWGIGLIVNQRWLAWRFVTPYHPSLPVDRHGHVIMSWAELTALEIGLLALIAAGYRDTRVRVHSDNDGVVYAMREHKWKANHGLDVALRRILKMCADAKLQVEVEWVSTKMNPADKPSRGVFPPAQLMFEHAPDLPDHLEGVVQIINVI